MTKLIVGCGYLGSRVAALWSEAGQQVLALTRSTEHARTLSERGLRTIVADVTRPETLAGLPAADTVLVAYGYDAAAGCSRHDVYCQGLSHLLAALPEATGRLLYISSTGVYGHLGGDWVTEQSPCRPDREAARAFVEAERRLADHPLGAQSVVLRMAGLYGPGRIPRRKELIAGQPLAVPADSFLNLIHVDDMARTVVAAAAAERPSRLYLASDGHPVQRREYFAYLAQLLSAPDPRFIEPDPKVLREGRGGGSKRISNALLLRELHLQLRWPSYRDALADALAATPPSPSGRGPG